MSILVGDIDRARLAHDIHRRREETFQDGFTQRDQDGSMPLRNQHNSIPSRSQDGNAYLLDWTSGACIKKDLTPDEFDREMPSAAAAQKILVLRGLPPEYVRLLLTDRVLAGNTVEGVDLAFINAQAERRGCRPVGKRRGDLALGVSFEAWEYPELVQGFDSTTKIAERDVAGVRAPTVLPLGQGDLGVAFCRLAVWSREGCTPVLFLDPPVWEGNWPLRKARRGIYDIYQRLATEQASQPGVRRSEGHTLEEILSLEDILPSVPESHEGETFPRGDILVEMVFDRWLDLFEILAQSHRSREAMVACFWQIQHSLEQNKHAALFRSKLDGKKPSHVDWDGLLSQLNQRMTLLLAMPGRRPALTPSSTVISQTRARYLSRAGTLGATGTLPPGRTPGRTGREILDEDHRALDRISYLGGILIPLPIVSGILSMGDTYGPDGPKFFIFWAVSLPLAVVAVLVIYADTIRKAEVWVEVATEHVAAFPSSDADEGEKMGLWGYRRGANQGDEEAQISQTGIPGAPVAEEGSEAEEVALPVLVSLGPDLLGVESETPEVILETPTNGEQKAWRRKKLGWGGAAKAILYRKPRYCADDSPEGVAAYDKRRKTRPIDTR